MMQLLSGDVIVEDEAVVALHADFNVLLGQITKTQPINVGNINQAGFERLTRSGSYIWSILKSDCINSRDGLNRNEIVKGCVTGSTFRSFRSNNGDRPSHIFRQFLFYNFEEIFNEFVVVAEQADFNELLHYYAQELAEFFNENHIERPNGDAVSVVICKKLLNLFLKMVSQKCCEFTQIEQFLHVPLDKFTLRAIRSLAFCLGCQGFDIPPNAGMGWAGLGMHYDEIQIFVRNYCLGIEYNGDFCLPIHFEVGAWNLAR